MRDICIGLKVQKEWDNLFTVSTCLHDSEVQGHAFAFRLAIDNTQYEFENMANVTGAMLAIEFWKQYCNFDMGRIWFEHDIAYLAMSNYYNTHMDVPSKEWDKYIREQYQKGIFIINSVSKEFPNSKKYEMLSELISKATNDIGTHVKVVEDQLSYSQLRLNTAKDLKTLS